VECIEEFQMQSPKHQLIIDGDKNITVTADRNRIEQVLVNLVSNAIKYSPDADQVIIGVEQLKKGIRISITDFGIGIPKNNLPLIFDRFYRVDEKSQRYAGLGLGLYISAEIVRRHDGHINIESEEGKGSTFWFVIP
jgi:two-component system CheB/CheR fusion protein